MVLKAESNLFSQMILVAENRSMNMKGFLAHPPAHCHGLWQMQMVPTKKTYKAALATELEKNLSPAEAITTPSTCIIGSGTKDKRQQQNICTTGRVCLVHDTVCGWTAW